MIGSSTAFHRFAETTKFSASLLRDVLSEKLTEIQDEGAILRQEWEPLLDSLVVVSALIAVQPIVGFRLPPDQTIRKGGYHSVEEAIDDMAPRIEKLYREKQKGKGSK